MPTQRNLFIWLFVVNYLLANNIFCRKVKHYFFCFKKSITFAIPFESLG